MSKTKNYYKIKCLFNQYKPRHKPYLTVFCLFYKGNAMFEPTQEQQYAIELAEQGKSLKLIAFAGAGKTASLKLIAERLAPKQGLYLAFNKSIAQEAQNKMPRNVESRTFHAKAYALSPIWLKEKQAKDNALSVKEEQDIIMAGNCPSLVCYLGFLGFATADSETDVQEAGVLLCQKKAEMDKNLLSYSVKQRVDKDTKGRLFFKKYTSGFSTVQLIRRVVTEYLKSTEKDITEKFIKEFLLKEYRVPLNAYEMTNSHAQEMFEYVYGASVRLLNFYLNSKYSVPFGMGFDMYVKMWQLTKPKLDYDFILYDEAQDADPVMLDILKDQHNQGVQVILVGDPHQQIYEWRGAINAMQGIEQIKDTTYLTKSFRFGPHIAQVGDTVLKYLGESNTLCSGRPDINDFQLVTHVFSQVVSPDEGLWRLLCQVDEISGTLTSAEGLVKLGGDELLKNSQAILCHTNIVCFAFAIYCYEQQRAFKMNVDVQSTLDILGILDDIKREIPLTNKKLPKIFKENNIKDKDSLTNYLLGSYQPDYNIAYGWALLHKYDKQTIERILNQSQERNPNAITISTVHKAKGMEWQNVIVSDDLVEEVIRTYLSSLLNKETNQEVIRTFYVALTRAKEVLIVGKKYQVAEMLIKGLINKQVLKELYQEYIDSRAEYITDTKTKEKSRQKEHQATFFNVGQDSDMLDTLGEKFGWSNNFDYQRKQSKPRKSTIADEFDDDGDGDDGEVWDYPI